MENQYLNRSAWLSRGLSNLVTDFGFIDLLLKVNLANGNLMRVGKENVRIIYYEVTAEHLKEHL